MRVVLTFAGYQQVGENVTEGQRDWHEAIDLMKHFPSSHPDVLAKKALYGPNQWPERPPQLQSFFEDYVNQLLNLGEYFFLLHIVRLVVCDLQRSVQENKQYLLMSAKQSPVALLGNLCDVLKLLLHSNALLSSVQYIPS